MQVLQEALKKVPEIMDSFLKSCVSARNPALQMHIKICSDSTLGPFQGVTSPSEMTILTVVNKGHQDQIPICIIPIIAIEALDSGISSTDAIYIHQVYPSHTPIRI